jgi:L-lactate dehydrogenase complex protein LldE
MRVALFIPCLVDRFLPEIGQASVAVLEAAGVRVSYDPRQTCCGQPWFNAGCFDMAVPFARKMIRLFEKGDPVVAPSGSCVAMIRDSYGDLDLTERELTAWNELRKRVFDLAEFLVLHGLEGKLETRFDGRAAVHYSCHHLRHVGGRRPLDALLARVEGLEVLRSPEAERCCGFGGIFSAKLPALSIAMARDRLASIAPLSPDIFVLADAGCVLQMRGVRQGPPAPVIHYAQLLAGMVPIPQRGSEVRP